MKLSDLQEMSMMGDLTYNLSRYLNIYKRDILSLYEWVIEDNE